MPNELQIFMVSNFTCFNFFYFLNPNHLRKICEFVYFGLNPTVIVKINLLGHFKKITVLYALFASESIAKNLILTNGQ